MNVTAEDHRAHLIFSGQDLFGPWQDSWSSASQIQIFSPGSLEWTRPSPYLPKVGCHWDD